MTENLKIAAYDKDGILGIGDTPEQALAEAEGFLTDHADNPHTAISELKTAPVSDALLDEILRVGFPFDIAYMPIILGPDGILWIDDGESKEDEDRLFEFAEEDLPY